MSEAGSDSARRNDGIMDVEIALEKISVVDLNEGKRTDLPDGSWACELVSGALNGAERTCMGFFHLETWGFDQADGA